MVPDSLLTTFAARQHGVVARAQLREAGWTVGRIDHLVRCGRLRPLFPGVYLLGALAGPLEPRLARVMAAVLASGTGAAVSHRTAAELWGLLPSHSPPTPVELVIPGRDRGRAEGLVPHRVRSILPADVTRLEGIPVTTPARTLLDLALRLRPRQLEQAVAEGERRGRLDPTDLEAALARHAGRAGTRAVRALLAGATGPAFTRSEAEERLLALIRKGGLSPPVTNARLGGMEVDVLWRAEGVVVEVDGFAHHRSRHSFEADRLRDARLSAMGLRVVRVTWRQLVDEPTRVLVRLAQVLAVARSG